MVVELPGSFQELPPRWAHFCLNIERFLRRDLGIDPAKSHFLCAYSGGVDSTALLLTLYFLGLKNGIPVSAAHLNHGLRKESAIEAVHCQTLCKALGISIYTKQTDVSVLAQDTGIGIEEAARNARYNFLNECRVSAQADWTALGHHLDDLSEDILMRLIRGTGWPGLSGMAGTDSRRNIVRPLLENRKETLKEFLTELNICWVEDASNKDLAMTRNRIRHSLLPLIYEENPNFHEAVLRLWKIGKIDEDFWLTAVDQTDTGTILPQSILENAHKALRLRLYKSFLNDLGPGQVLGETLLKMDEAWKGARYGTVFQYPGDRIGKITHRGVVFGFKH